MTRGEPALRASIPRDRLPRMPQNEQSAAPGRVRLDKWLWAARFFKTRSLAAEGIAGGKVTVNDERVKPARNVQAGDLVSVRIGPYQHSVLVRAVSERRGPASAAAELYEETDASRAARERLAEQLRMAPAAFVYEEKGRPTKRDRRDLERLRDERR